MSDPELSPPSFHSSSSAAASDSPASPRSPSPAATSAASSPASCPVSPPLPAFVSALAITLPSTTTSSSTAATSAPAVVLCSPTTGESPGAAVPRPPSPAVEDQASAELFVHSVITGLASNEQPVVTQSPTSPCRRSTVHSPFSQSSQQESPDVLVEVLEDDPSRPGTPPLPPECTPASSASCGEVSAAPPTAAEEPLQPFLDQQGPPPPDAPTAAAHDSRPVVFPLNPHVHRPRGPPLRRDGHLQAPGLVALLLSLRDPEAIGTQQPLPEQANGFQVLLDTIDLAERRCGTAASAPSHNPQQSPSRASVPPSPHLTHRSQSRGASVTSSTSSSSSPEATPRCGPRSATRSPSGSSSSGSTSSTVSESPLPRIVSRRRSRSSTRTPPASSSNDSRARGGRRAGQVGTGRDRMDSTRSERPERLPSRPVPMQEDRPRRSPALSPQSSVRVPCRRRHARPNDASSSSSSSSSSGSSPSAAPRRRSPSQSPSRQRRRHRRSPAPSPEAVAPPMKRKRGRSREGSEPEDRQRRTLDRTSVLRHAVVQPGRVNGTASASASVRELTPDRPPPMNGAAHRDTAAGWGAGRPTQPRPMASAESRRAAGGPSLLSIANSVTEKWLWWPWVPENLPEFKRSEPRLPDTRRLLQSSHSDTDVASFARLVDYAFKSGSFSGKSALPLLVQNLQRVLQRDRNTSFFLALADILYNIALFAQQDEKFMSTSQKRSPFSLENAHTLCTAVFQHTVVSSAIVGEPKLQSYFQFASFVARTWPAQTDRSSHLPVEVERFLHLVEDELHKTRSHQKKRQMEAEVVRKVQEGMRCVLLSCGSPVPLEKTVMVDAEPHSPALREHVQWIRLNTKTPLAAATERVRQLLTSGGDVEVTNMTVTLLCPIGRRRILFPGKGLHCSHVECFDLMTFLTMNFTNQKLSMKDWSCPVCDQQVRLTDLVFDSYFDNILCHAGPDTEHVVVEPDAKWQEVQKSKPSFIEAISIDDD